MVERLHINVIITDSTISLSLSGYSKFKKQKIRKIKVLHKNMSMPSRIGMKYVKQGKMFLVILYMYELILIM